MNRRDAGRLLATAALAGILPRSKGELGKQPGRPSFSVMLWTLEQRASFDRCLEIVAEAGYQGVELVGEFGKWTPAELQRITAKLRSLNLRVDAMSGVKAGFAVPAATDAFFQQLDVQMHWARLLDCPQIILLSGARVPSLNPDAQRQTAIENLKRAAERTASNHLSIVIEPIDRLEDPAVFLQSVSEGFDIVRSVHMPNVRVLYDLFHEQRGSGNLIEKLEKNIDLVGLIHVADVPGRHEPGTGEIRYEAIYRTLAGLGYNRFIAMEFLPTGDPTVSLRRAREQAEQAFTS